jgi:hypothetical protein
MACSKTLQKDQMELQVLPTAIIDQEYKLGILDLDFGTEPIKKH